MEVMFTIRKFPTILILLAKSIIIETHIVKPKINYQIQKMNNKYVKNPITIRKGVKIPKKDNAI